MKEGSIMEDLCRLVVDEPQQRPASTAGYSTANRLLFADKEYSDYGGESHHDFGTRHLASSVIPRFTTMDPLCEKRPDESPYIFAAANPVMNIDPTGLEWYYYKDLLYDSVDDIKEVVKPTVELTILYCESKEDFERKRNAGEITRGEFLGDVVIDFHGSLNEKLGKNGYLNGEGAVTADVTVYGPNGEDDIKHYTGFTMSSDFEAYGAIADGEYTVTYLNRPPPKKGLPKNYMINGRGPVDCLNGINPNKDGYSDTQKNGIFIHRTNNDGRANGTVSTGCLLILATQWNKFEEQVGQKKAHLILRRDK